MPPGSPEAAAGAAEAAAKAAGGAPPAAATGAQQQGGACGWEGRGAQAGGSACGAEGQQQQEAEEDIPVIVSGAGHDAMAMAGLTKASVRMQRGGGGRALESTPYTSNSVHVRLPV